MTGKRWTVAASVALAIAIFCAPPASAAGGELDDSFDNDGAAVTDFYSGTDDAGRAVAVQPDGKIVVAGSRGGEAIRANFAVARYNPDGSLDNSFGSAGRTTTDFDGDDDAAMDVAVQRDGKIVAVGWALIAGRRMPALVRYNADGRRDTTFGEDGRVVATRFYDNTYAKAVSIQSNGAIVIAVRLWNSNDVGDLVLARFAPTGDPDPGFDEDGIVVTGLGGDENIADVAIGPNGKIVAVGTRDDGDLDFVAARYTSGGDLDPSFDDDGKVSVGFGNDEVARSVALQSDGRIVIAGHKNEDFALARLNEDGSPDKTFDSDGKRSLDFGGMDRCHGVAVQADGKIVCAGSSWGAGRIHGDIALLRLTSRGSRDGSFSGDGMLTQGVSARDEAGGVALQRDGKIVVAGTSNMSGESSANGTDFAVLRFLSS